MLADVDVDRWFELRTACTALEQNRVVTVHALRFFLMVSREDTSDASILSKKEVSQTRTEWVKRTHLKIASIYLYTGHLNMHAAQLALEKRPIHMDTAQLPGESDDDESELN